MTDNNTNKKSKAKRRPLHKQFIFPIIPIIILGIMIYTPFYFWQRPPETYRNIVEHQIYNTEWYQIITLLDTELNNTLAITERVLEAPADLKYKIEFVKQQLALIDWGDKLKHYGRQARLAQWELELSFLEQLITLLEVHPPSIEDDIEAKNLWEELLEQLRQLYYRVQVQISDWTVDRLSSLKDNEQKRLTNQVNELLFSADERFFALREFKIVPQFPKLDTDDRITFKELEFTKLDDPTVIIEITLADSAIRKARHYCYEQKPIEALKAYNDAQDYMDNGYEKLRSLPSLLETFESALSAIQRAEITLSDSTLRNRIPIMQLKQGQEHLEASKIAYEDARRAFAEENKVHYAIEGALSSIRLAEKAANSVEVHWYEYRDVIRIQLLPHLINYQCHTYYWIFFIASLIIDILIIAWVLSSLITYFTMTNKLKVARVFIDWVMKA